jgi:quinol-cytochrome oxidoreductase complex cytochrome b subunit
MRQIAQARFRSTVTKLCFAAIGFSMLGYIVAHAVGNDAAPYESSLANAVAWHTFLVSGAVAIVVGLGLMALEIRDDRRRARAGR